MRHILCTIIHLIFFNDYFLRIINEWAGNRARRSVDRIREKAQERGTVGYSPPSGLLLHHSSIPEPRARAIALGA
jgi:hypothetical protein